MSNIEVKTLSELHVDFEEAVRNFESIQNPETACHLRGLIQIMKILHEEDLFIQ